MYHLKESCVQNSQYVLYHSTGESPAFLLLMALFCSEDI